MLTEKPWRDEAVLLFVGGLFASLFAGMTLAGVFHNLHVPGFRQSGDFGAVLVGTLSFQGAAWVLMGLFLHLHHMKWSVALGLRGPETQRAVLMGLFAGLLVLPCVLLLQVASVDLLLRLRFMPEEETAVALFKGLRNGWEQVYFAVFAIVIAPVAEEFIFRGMLFPWLKQRGSLRTAWLGVSALFALIHLDLGTLLPLFALALVLTWLYEKTDNLLAPIAAHAVFNAANLFLLLLAHEFSRKPPVQ